MVPSPQNMPLLTNSVGVWDVFFLPFSSFVCSSLIPFLGWLLNSHFFPSFCNSSHLLLHKIPKKHLHCLRIILWVPFHSNCVDLIFWLFVIVNCNVIVVPIRVVKTFGEVWNWWSVGWVCCGNANETYGLERERERCRMGNYSLLVQSKATWCKRGTTTSVWCEYNITRTVCTSIQ